MKHEKWDPKGKIGIFAECKLHSGYGWKDEYLVWDQASFKHSDLRSVSTHLHQQVGKPFVTRVCTLPEDGIVFPLKAHYEKVNAELFDPRITNEDYEPHDEARQARAPSFDEDAVVPPKKEEPKPEEATDDIKAEDAADDLEETIKAEEPDDGMSSSQCAEGPKASGMRTSDPNIQREQKEENTQGSGGQDGGMPSSS